MLHGELAAAGPSSLPPVSTLSATARLVRPLRPRDPNEPHRAASPLELLTDLCVVVAVGQAAANLHHGLATEHPLGYVIAYALAFFAIWCSWVNFSWFGSAYDNDDVAYRLLTILQIIGVLVLAAGVDGIFAGHFGVTILGYVIMRVSLIVQWLRASRGDPARRTTCRRYAIGTAVVQLGWIGYYWVGPHEAWRLPGFALLAAAEIAVPIIAERAGITPWHPHHIAERYSLLFLIVLGETILSSTVALKEGLTGGAEHRAPMWVLMVSGVLIVFSLWWTYFAHEASDVLADRQGESNVTAFAWGFGHYFIFAAAAAVGAGLAARAEYWLHPEEISGLTTAAGITVPAAVLLTALWFVQLRRHARSPVQGVVMLGTAVLVLAATFVLYAELVTGLLLAGELAAMLGLKVRRAASAGEVG